MASLKFVYQHNMVACLENSEENTEFHQIVDFLSTCFINYALTVMSHLSFSSSCYSFRNTLPTSKNVNSVKQIHAIVNDKAVVISESSVRNDLLFDDEDGITCLTMMKVLKNLTLMGVMTTFHKTSLFTKGWCHTKLLWGEWFQNTTHLNPTSYSPTHPSIGDQPPVTDSSSSHDTTQDSM
ncbi:hypothetical protein Tco_0405558 [Tanacetum coccineum]